MKEDLYIRYYNNQISFDELCNKIFSIDFKKNFRVLDFIIDLLK